MKICPICRSQFQTKAALAQHMATHTRQTGGARGRNPTARGGGGAFTMHCSGEEYLGTASSGTWAVAPGKSGLARLDQYAALFQEYRIDKWVVKIKPTVGTTSAGCFVAGVSYDFGHIPSSFRDIAVLAPKVTGTVWQAATLSASAQRLMRQTWMMTSGSGIGPDESVSGYVCLALDGAATTTTVAVWVDYSVTLQGPSSVSRTAADTIYTYDSRARKWVKDGADVNQTDAVGGPVFIDLEVKSGDASTLVAILKGVTDSLTTLHTATVDGITYVHLAASAVRQAALGVAAASAIVHIARAPFRPIGFSFMSGAGGRDNSPDSASSAASDGHCILCEQAGSDNNRAK